MGSECNPNSILHRQTRVIVVSKTWIGRELHPVFQHQRIELESLEFQCVPDGWNETVGVAIGTLYHDKCERSDGLADST